MSIIGRLNFDFSTVSIYYAGGFLLVIAWLIYLQLEVRSLKSRVSSPGCQSEIRASADTKFVRAVKVTAANTHYGHHLEELLESGELFMQRTDDGVVEEAPGIGEEVVAVEEESSNVDEGSLADSREASDSSDEVPGIYADGAHNSKANQEFIKTLAVQSRYDNMLAEITKQEFQKAESMSPVLKGLVLEA